MGTYTSAEIAKKIGIHKDTLLRWLKRGLVPEPKRDRHGWRIFTETEASTLIKFANQESQAVTPATDTTKIASYSPIRKLSAIDWDFKDAETGYLTHGMHPYPAKFIPQIPNTLIQELSSVGETVLDIFCGSGTTLVEALVLKRNCIGIDANPLGCLISRAKTAFLSEQEKDSLQKLQERVEYLAENQLSHQYSLFKENDFAFPNFDLKEDIQFWFEPFVIEELSKIKHLCKQVPTENARDVALTAFSSIIVSVSRQDSDTRYVRKQKNIKEGDTLIRFARTLESARRKSESFSEAVEKKFRPKIINANILNSPDIGTTADLMVCSPPYPNAYSYHLYHRTRMLWLDMDQSSFKTHEIGSHRKYSRKGNGRATVQTFRTELSNILLWLTKTLKINGYACFVIGDSILNGNIIRNDELLVDAAKACGYSLEADFTRNIQDTRKSFNPAIGKIRTEHVVILRNNGVQNA